MKPHSSPIDKQKKVTTVLKVEGGTTKIREGAFGVTITGNYKGEQSFCETEYGVNEANEARMLVVIALHWLNDTFPEVVSKAIATFLIESGKVDKNVEGIFLKIKNI